MILNRLEIHMQLDFGSKSLCFPCCVFFHAGGKWVGGKDRYMGKGNDTKLTIDTIIKYICI